jgi:hypothetical protein
VIETEIFRLRLDDLGLDLILGGKGVAIEKEELSRLGRENVGHVAAVALHESESLEIVEGLTDCLVAVTGGLH